MPLVPENRAGEPRALFGEELLAHDRAQGMAEEHERQTGKISADAPADRLEVVEAFAPAVLRGEEAEICGRAARPVAAMIARIDRKAGAGERDREPLVARAMFGEAVGDLHREPRRRLGPPAPHEDHAAVAREGEDVGLHDTSVATDVGAPTVVEPSAIPRARSIARPADFAKRPGSI